MSLRPESDAISATSSELAFEGSKFGTLFNSEAAAMAFWRGPEMTFEKVNAKFQALFSGRELLHRKVFEALPEFEDQPLLQPLKKVFESGESFSGHEIRAHHRRTEAGPPEERYYDFTYLQIKDSSGKAYGVLGHVIDITDWVIARQALEESEGRFKQVANALPQIIWTATPDGHVDWYNDWWFKYLGAPRGTQWNDPEKQPMHPDDVPRTLMVWGDCLATGKHYTMEQRFRRASDGQYRWHRVSGLPVRGADGQIIRWVGGNMDIHDQKEFTASLEQERELRERFVATLTHDLRTPLTAARMSAQLLGRRSGDPAMIQKISARIVDSIDRADQMIRDLLDANRLKAGEPLPLEIGPCDLNEIVADTLAELSTVHGDRFILNSESELKGRWDLSAVRRIVENLCSNAVKYGAPYSSVTLTLAEQEDEITIAVHNQGNPIAQEDQKRLFDPFNRTESAKSSGQKGWGLGLTLVRGLAEAHGGSVSVESSEPQGTSFKVRLPKDAEKFRKQ